MLLLLPLLWGTWVGILGRACLGLPTTGLAFTDALKHDGYIVAIYSFGMGAAEIFVSTALVLILLSVPDMATIKPTTDQSLLITPSRIVVVITGFLMGMGDFTITMGRAVICQVAVPNARMQVFSMSRLYQENIPSTKTTHQPV
ncbi:hypothetical protein OSTOST_20608 [Ostertagia ostertagi]